MSALEGGDRFAPRRHYAMRASVRFAADVRATRHNAAPGAA